MRATLSLYVIVGIALLLRFWQLGAVPPSPDWDEVALGYNAYSILETGRDEYGKFMPVVLRSFDDYKPALYAYLVIPFIKLFDVTVFAVRLPSALFGVLSIIATYFLVKELFHKRVALLSAFLLAISPWHIQFSRIAFEANVGVAFNIFAALLFLKGLKKPWLLLASAAVAGLSLYVYQSEKVFTPLLFLALIAIFWRQVFRVSKTYLISAVLLGVVVSLPMAYFIATNQEALARAQGVSVFSNQTEFLKRNVQKLADDQKNSDILGLFLDNRRFVYVKSILSGYLAHFDLNWLFVRGDLARHHAPDMGLLYLWELPFLLIGIYILIFGPPALRVGDSGSETGGFDRRAKAFIFAWFLIAPIPASITSGVPHAVRTLNFLPTFQIFTAIGIIFALQRISNFQLLITNYKLRYIFVSFYLLLVTFNVLYYFNQYSVQQNYFFSKDWQYGYEQAIQEIVKIEQKYDKIIVSNTPHMDQSYMFFLFYLKYPPDVYQKEAQGASGGFKENHIFGKFEFRPLNWSNEIKTPRTLFVGREDDFPGVYEGHVKTINFLNRKPAIVLVEGK